MTQELFQPEISVKNGLDGKIRLARAEARSLVAKRSIFKTVAATAADMGGGKGGGRYGRRQRWPCLKRSFSLIRGFFLSLNTLIIE